MTLQNLASWSLQVAVLVIAGALLPVVFRLRLPRARLICWQALLAGCLLLPLIQPWKRPVADSSISFTQSPVTVLTAPGPQSAPLPLAETVLVVLVAGMALRALWLALGFWRLRRYRDASRALWPLPAAVEAAERRLGVRADFRVSDEIAGPITFGLRYPVVLFPPGLLELDPALWENVVCHELLHVRRRDWAWTVFEECVRAALWFHPAIWWLLGKIQLAREQTVDARVIELTRAPREYVEALLAIASARPRLDLAPAPLFLRKRHLAQRVGAILKEVTMSKRRMVSSLVSVFGLLILAGWLAAWQFPLQGKPQQDASGVAVKEGDLKLLHRAAVAYPSEAKRKRVEGEVVLELDVSEDGNVTDARVLDGPRELRKAALQSVLQWHYANDAGLPAKTRVTVNFKLTEEAAKPVQRGVAGGIVGGVPGGGVGAGVNRAGGGVQPAGGGPAGPVLLYNENLYSQAGVLKRIETGSLPAALQQRLQSKLARFEGQTLSLEMLKEFEQEAHAVDEHLTLSVGQGVVRLRLPGTASSTLSAEQRIRVGGNAQQRKLVSKSQPVYPPEAKAARIQGMVRLTATIGRDGKVKILEIISGHPILAQAALDAVKSWIYEPTLLNGEPVEVITQIDVNFTLLEKAPGEGAPQLQK